MYWNKIKTKNQLITEQQEKTEKQIMEWLSVLPDLSKDPHRHKRYNLYMYTLKYYYNEYKACREDALPIDFFERKFRKQIKMENEKVEAEANKFDGVPETGLMLCGLNTIKIDNSAYDCSDHFSGGMR